MIYLYRDGNHSHIHQEEAGGSILRLVLHPSQTPVMTSTLNEYVEVCSISNFSGCVSGEQILERMTKITANRHGGYRALTEEELTSALLARDEQCPAPGNMLIPNTNLELLSRHPLIKSGVAFATGNVVTLPLVTLMRDIYDPLRFIDPQHPERNSRLVMHYSLHRPRATIKVLTDRPRTPHEVRCLIMCQAWYTCAYPQMTWERLEQEPCAFLFRYMREAMQEYEKTENKNTAYGLGLWKTSKRYSLFVRLLWLHGIGASKFDPERFFRRPDEVEGFLKHIKAVD